VVGEAMRRRAWDVWTVLVMYCSGGRSHQPLRDEATADGRDAVGVRVCRLS
jgi:hypothetical protein